MSDAGRILLADDEQALLTALSKVLGEKGYECDCARDATEAAARLRAGQYDLLISDVEMPGNRDLALVRQLSELAPDLPVIIITAFPSVQSAIQSVQLPVAAYLVKPITMDVLLLQVRRTMQHSRACRAIGANHQRVQKWNQDLEQIRRLIKTARPADAAPWQALLSLTIQNIAAALVDLKTFTEAATSQQGSATARHMLQASRPILLLEALLDTINVLEKTKHSFKSKELGDLRKRLEALLEAKP